MIENKLSTIFESDLNEVVGGDGELKQHLENFGKGLVNGVASVPIFEHNFLAKEKHFDLPYTEVTEDTPPTSAVIGSFIGREGTLIAGAGALVVAGVVACKAIQYINKLRK